MILPLTVLRRLNCVLAARKTKVLETQARFKGKLENLGPQLRAASGFAFYNTSRYDFEKLLADAPHLAANLRNHRWLQPEHVRGAREVRLRQHDQQAGRGGPSLPGAGAFQERRAPQGHGITPGELETLSRIIAELNERFGLNLGPEHRVTLGQMMEKLDDDAALDAAARVNTRENVRLTFGQKVEHVIQEIVDSNFDLYKRITDDRALGEAIKNFLFDQYLRAHRNAEELIKAGESKTLEFKSTLRWSLKEDRQDKGAAVLAEDHEGAPVRPASPEAAMMWPRAIAGVCLTATTRAGRPSRAPRACGVIDRCVQFWALPETVWVREGRPLCFGPGGPEPCAMSSCIGPCWG